MRSTVIGYDLPKEEVLNASGILGAKGIFHYDKIGESAWVLWYNEYFKTGKTLTVR